MHPNVIKKALVDLYQSSIPQRFTQIHVDLGESDDELTTTVNRVYDLRLGGAVQILIADPVTKAEAIEALHSAIRKLEDGGLPDTEPLYLPDGKIIGVRYSENAATDDVQAESPDIKWLINDELWDEAEWKGVAYIDWPEDNMPPCIGLVFGDAQSGKEIFANWVNRLGWIDNEEQIRVGIIEGVVPGKALGYSIRISVNPFWAEIYVRGYRQERNPARQIAVGRVHRAATSDTDHLLNFKTQFKKYGSYFILPITIHRPSGSYVPHYSLAIQKREIYFRHVSELAEDDPDSKAVLGEEIKRSADNELHSSLGVWEPISDFEPLSERLRSNFGRQRELSVRDIQSNYFDILDNFVGHLYAKMRESSSDPHRMGLLFVGNDRYVRKFFPAVEKYIDLSKEFWAAFAPSLQAEVQRIESLKSVYSGDIFPSYVRNIASSIGLYVDTILLPDPLLQFSKLREFAKPDRLLYYVVKHALNALKYRELALAELDPPIVLIAPGSMDLDESVAKSISEAGQVDALYHCSKLFGREFADDDELLTFLTQFKNPEQIISSIVEPSRLLFDTDWQESLDQQLLGYIREMAREAGIGKTQQFIPHIGAVIHRSLIGRMMQANEALYKASRFNGAPMVEAPTSWQYFVWKNEYDRERAQDLGIDIVDMAITKALHSRESKDIKILTSLPEKVLVDLRQRGAMADLRQMIRRGVEDINAARQSSLADVVEAVTQNISDALTKHELEIIQYADSKKRFFGYDVSALIAVGSMAITAAATGNIPLSVISAGLGLTGAPTFKDLWAKGKKLLSEGQELKRSPTSILFNYIDVNAGSITDRYRPKSN